MPAPVEQAVVPEPEERRASRRPGVALAWCAGAAALVAAALWARSAQPTEANARAGAGPSGAPGAKPPSVRVLTLAPRPFSIVLEGLGTVTPLATVTVRAQVDGPLLSVAFQEGAPVKRGQLLAEIDPRPYRIKLSQARAATARAEAQLKNAQLDLARYASLADQKLIARQQLDSQQALVDQLAAGVAADQANAAQAQLQLDYTRIESPIDAVAGIRQVDPGNLVRATDTTGIVVLTQLDPIAVLFTLPQDQLPPLSAAMAAGSPRVELWSRDGSQLLAVGVLQVIDNQINTETASLRLKARVDNAQRKLWPNQFVRARVTVSRQEAALVLPAAAVQHGPDGAYVYVVSADNRAHLRPVRVALLQGEQALIADGVQPQERVVIAGQEQVKPDALVSPLADAGTVQGAAGGAAGAP